MSQDRMGKIGKLLDALPLAPLLLVALLLGGAPFLPEPHLFEKMRMLAAGTLARPIDIFDLFYHGTPLIVLFLKLIRLKNSVKANKE